jgi:hypothetical protein
MKMKKNTFNIADARDDIKALNDYLAGIVEEVQNRTALIVDLEKLFNDDEFAKLMSLVRFFSIDGNAYLAECHSNLAKLYAAKATA